MLDDDNGVALVDKTVEHAQQHLDVLEVQTGRRLVKDIDGLARVALGQLAGQFHTLALSTRKCARGLPQLDVAQAHILQHLDLAQYRRLGIKELHRLVDGHIEHVGNRLTLELHFQRLAVVSLATTFLTGHEHVGQEIHLHRLVAIAVALLATAATRVEREAPGLVGSDLGFGQVDEQGADVGEHASIGRGIGSRCAAQRRLVDGDHLIHMLQTLDGVIGHRRGV